MNEVIGPMNIRRRKKGFLLQCLLIASLMVTAISPSFAAQARLSLAFAGTYEMNEGIVQAARAFEQANPDIAIELLPTASGRAYYDRLTVMAVGGTAPDVALVAYQFLPPFIDMGVLIDLKPFLDRPGGLRERDFVPIVLESLSLTENCMPFPETSLPCRCTSMSICWTRPVCPFRTHWSRLRRTGISSWDVASPETSMATEYSTNL